MRIEFISRDADPRLTFDQSNQVRPQDLEHFPQLAGVNSGPSFLGIEPSTLTHTQSWSSIVRNGRLDEVKKNEELDTENSNKSKGVIFKKQSTGLKFGLIDRSKTFMRIFPLEIRQQCYEEAMRLGGHIDDMTWLRGYIYGTDSRPGFLPAVCFASRTVMNEAAPVYISNVTFIVTSFQSNQFFLRFLESLPGETGFRAVRSLRFDFFDCFPGGPVNNDIELMARCSGLRKVQFRFHVRNLLEEEELEVPTLDEYFFPKSVDQVVEYYHLRRILDCELLERVVLRGVQSMYYFERSAVSGLTVLKKIGEWLVEEYEKKYARKIIVEVI